MKAFHYGEPQLFEAFIKSAQYIARLRTQQDIWEQVGRLVISYFPAEWTAFVQRDAVHGLSIHNCSLPHEAASASICLADVQGIIGDVLDSGFLATSVISVPSPSMTAFIPIVEERQPGRLMLIGHGSADPIPNDLLNIYLAVAGLAGTTSKRLHSELELNRHRAHLEELVRERTAELVRAKRQNELILDSVEEGICGVDLHGRITFANPSAARLLGWDPHELVGQDSHDTFHHSRPGGEAYPEEECFLHSALKNGINRHAASELLWRKDGTSFPVEFTTTPIAVEGDVVGAVLVFRDITERRRAEAEREMLLESEQEARAEAEAAVRVRDEFISIAAHELKTPVTALQGFAQLTLRELVRTGAVEPVRLSRAMDRIEQQSKRLSKLTDQLLSLSRLQTGKLTLAREETNIDHLVRRAITDMQYSREGRPIELCDGKSAVALIDPLRVEQVLINLMDNAIKFSPSDSAIEIVVGSRDPEWVEISVRDYGIGIPAGEEERIFERFHQAHPGRHAGGMGIGLFVCRQIVEMHGGTLAVEQPAEGGSRFVLRLPVIPPDDTNGITGKPKVTRN